MTTTSAVNVESVNYVKVEPIGIRASLLIDGARLPKRAYDTDAGLDLYTPIDFTLMPHKHLKVSTGVAMEIPKNFFGMVQAKSGLAAKHGINTFGNVIDSSYRGSISVILINYGDEPLHFGQGDKIAQLIIIPCSLQNLIEVPYEKLSQTERGIKGFGSTS